MTGLYVFTGVAGIQSRNWYGEIDTLDVNGTVINQIFNWTYYLDPQNTPDSYALNALYASDPLPTTASDVSIGAPGGAATYDVSISGRDSYGSTAAARIATIAEGSSVTISGAGGLTLGSGLVNDGTVRLTSGGILYSGGDVVTLSGNGQIVMSYLQDGYTAQIRAGSSQQTLVNRTTISGTGQIGASYNSYGDNGNELNFINETSGVVDGNGNVSPGSDNGQLVLQMHNAITNNGVLRGSGTGGLLIFQNTVRQGATGRIEATGQGSLVTLAGATVQGGTFATSDGGVIAIGNFGGNSGGPNLLDGASGFGAIHNQGSFLIADGTSTAAKGTLDNAGTITLNATGHGATLQVSQGDLTLTGGGSIRMTSVPGGYSYNSLITGCSQNTSTVLHNASNTISGAGTIGSNYGSIGDAGYELALDNQAGGMIWATETGDQALQLSMHQGVSNAGAIVDTGSAGLVINATTVTQSGRGYIGAAGQGAHVDLRQSTINGGILITVSGAVIRANTATLDGGTAAGAVTNIGAIDSSYLTITGQIVNRGSITGYINVGSAGATLSGGGGITLSTLSGSSAFFHNVDNVVNGSGAVLVNFQNDAGGVINADSSTDSITLYSGTDSNAGLIEATGQAGLRIVGSTIDQRSGGRLFVGDGSVIHLGGGATLLGGSLQGTGTGFYDVEGATALAAVNIAAEVRVAAGRTLSDVGDVANAGVVHLNGGALQVNGNWTGGGHVALAAGSTLSVMGALTNVDNLLSGVGTVVSGATGSSLINAGTIDADSSGGVLAIAGGLSLANSGLLEAENGGTLSVAAAVTGSGTALVKNGGTLSFENAFQGNVTFSGDGTSEALRLARAYSGTISGFGLGDRIDLTNLTYSGQLSVSYAGSFTSGTLAVRDGSGATLASLKLAGAYIQSDFTLADDGAGHALLRLSALNPIPPQPSPVFLPDFGLAQGWGSLNNPRRFVDLDGNHGADYLAFGAEYTFVASGGTFANGQGRTGPSFVGPAAIVHDFGTNMGYTAQAQRGAAMTGAGVAASVYGQGYAGVYWYAAQSPTSRQDAAGQTYSVPIYDSAPHFYANFGTQQGWTEHNGFQILKTSTSDAYASILGFGNDGIVVGGQAFAPGADASQATVLPASIGNTGGWDQLTDVRTFLDSDGGIVDLNHDGVADFIGMGPQGTVFAYGQEDPSSHQYTLGPVQTATFGGSTDLGRAQGWTDQNTQRLVVHDAVTGTDDILAFGAAGVFVAEGQDPSSNGGQPFGALHLAIADFGSNQGWSNALTPRLVGDVNGDGTPDIVGFGASSTFVALGARDASGHLSFTMDPTKTIGDFGYQEGWDSATTVRALADVDGSGHQSLVLSGYAGTQVWQVA